MENVANLLLEERLNIHKTEYLATHKPNVLQYKKHIGSGKGTFVERDLFESPAFIALGGVAPQMLIYFLGKRHFRKPHKNSKTRTCVNETDLKFSYIELQKLGITQPRGTRGFDELLAKGFITIKHRGGGFQKDQTVYALSNQWQFWKKGKVFEERQRVMKRGFQNARKSKINIRKRNHTRI